MLFTFRRDDEGRETIEIGGLAVARITNTPEGFEGFEGFEWLNSLPGITAEHVREAAVKADEAGFWADAPLSKGGCIYVYLNDEVTVDVPVAETTSTILTIGNTEDQA